MERKTCPGCGAPWGGKRCRSCGYEPFREEPRSGSAPSRNHKNPRKKHPLLGFLVLLALIWAMMPLLRNWGLKLETIENSHATRNRESAVSPEDVFTLYRNKDLHIFTTNYDAEHLTSSLTLYIQNNSDRDLLLRTDALLVNGDAVQQELYCKATAKSITKNWLRFDPGAGSSEIRSVAFRLNAYDGEGNLQITTDLILLGKAPDAAEPYF